MSTTPHTRNRRLTPLEGARLLRAWHQRGNVLQSTFCLLNGVSAPTLRRWLRKAASGPHPQLTTFTEVSAPALRGGVIQVCIGASQVSIPMDVDASSLHAVFVALIRAQGQGASC